MPTFYRQKAHYEYTYAADQWLRLESNGSLKLVWNLPFINCMITDMQGTDCFRVFTRDYSTYVNGVGSRKTAVIIDWIRFLVAFKQGEIWETCAFCQWLPKSEYYFRKMNVNGHDYYWNLYESDDAFRLYFTFNGNYLQRPLATIHRLNTKCILELNSEALRLDLAKSCIAATIILTSGKVFN